MLITTTQAYIFQKYVYKTVTNAEGKEEVRHEVVDKFKLPLTDTPVPAPDWIKETQLWELAMRDGTIGVFEEKRGAC